MNKTCLQSLWVSLRVDRHKISTFAFPLKESVSKLALLWTTITWKSSKWTFPLWNLFSCLRFWTKLWCFSIRQLTWRHRLWQKSWFNVSKCDFSLVGTFIGNSFSYSTSASAFKNLSFEFQLLHFTELFQLSLLLLLELPSPDFNRN